MQNQFPKELGKPERFILYFVVFLYSHKPNPSDPSVRRKRYIIHFLHYFASIIQKTQVEKENSGNKTTKRSKKKQQRISTFNLLTEIKHGIVVNNSYNCQSFVNYPFTGTWQLQTNNSSPSEDKIVTQFRSWSPCAIDSPPYSTTLSLVLKICAVLLSLSLKR